MNRRYAGLTTVSASRTASHDKILTAALTSVCTRFYFALSVLGHFSLASHGFAPWAVFLRRFAAKICRLIPRDFEIRSSPTDSQALLHAKGALLRSFSARP